MKGILRVAEGWRKTPLAWRCSVGEGSVGAAVSFWPMDASRKRERLGIPAGSMAVEAYAPQGNARGSAFEAGLKHGDVIVAVNGESPDLAGRAWAVWFKMKYEPGDRITLTVQEAAGRRREVTFVAR